MFGEAVIAQQLIVDVQRALDEGSTRDAKGLAHELSDTATHAAQLLEALPAWAAGQAATVAIATLLNFGSRAGDAYSSYFAHGAASDLRQARNLRRQDGNSVPIANDELAQLAAAGLRCGDTALQLESP
jgi:hypothetical protein